MQHVSIRIMDGEEIDFFAAMPERWEKMTGTLVQVEQKAERAVCYLALVFSKDDEVKDHIQMALVSVVSGTKIGGVDVMSYEDAMQSRVRFITDRLQEHIEIVGGVKAMNEINALRLAEIILELGPQQEKQLPKKKRKGQADE